jgi:phage terminase small subunit
MRARWVVFAEEYLRDWNQTQAAIRAGYSKKTAYNIGYYLRHNPKIDEYIQKRLSEMQADTDEIKTKLTDIARASPEIFIDFMGSTWTINLNKAHEAQKLHLIKSIKHTRDGYVIEMHDPLKALELLGRAKGLFIDKIKVDAPLSVVGLDSILDKAYGSNSSS